MERRHRHVPRSFIVARAGDRTKEADFLFHRGGSYDLAEAKWTEHPDQRDAEALLQVAAELPRGRARRRAIVCRAANPYPLEGNVQAIPLDSLDELLEEPG